VQSKGPTTFDQAKSEAHSVTEGLFALLSLFTG
jgi:hypothetical protein